MQLNKYKLGKLIEWSDERNENLEYGLKNVKGISIKKEFIETKADMDGVSLKPYKIVKKDYFAYVPITSRNGDKITLAHNVTNNTYIVSSSYIVFKVIKPEILNSDYLFMYFNRFEFDRYSRFNSWGSAREAFSWQEMCDIEIELPSVKIQEKYVNIYKSMLENQKCYEKGLDDLKLTCDAYLDKLKNTNNLLKIENFIEKTDLRNIESKDYKFKGLSMENYFIDSIANEKGIDFSKYKIIKPNEFACVLMKVGRDCRLTIAQNTSNENYIISPAYYTFKLNNINPTYFMSYVSRLEFERRAWFSCDTSLRGSLPWEEFCDLKIPNASKKDQEIVSNLFNVYINRKNINEKLKEQIKNICPILIKGAIEEAKK